MFKTSGGKYIAPQQIENQMKESRFIAQIMVVGENRKFPAALIVPAFQTVVDYFNEKDVDWIQIGRSLPITEVNALIESEIRRLNEHFGRYSQIKRFVLLAEEWSIGGGS